MDLEEFARATELTQELEIGKAKLLAYYLYRERALREFTITDLLALWGQLPISQPNQSRLRNQLERSREFPRASGSPVLFRLHGDARDTLDGTIGHLWTAPKARSTRRGGVSFVDPTRIDELRALIGVHPDPKRLVRLCEEINLAFEQECFLSVALLARTVINHVPPALGHKTFSEVANNYGGDPKTHKSFKKVAQRLEEVARNIGDMIAHETMRPVESLPGPAQIDFSQEFDVLLAEVARVLRERNIAPPAKK